MTTNPWVTTTPTTEPPTTTEPAVEVPTARHSAPGSGAPAYLAAVHGGAGASVLATLSGLDEISRPPRSGDRLVLVTRTHVAGLTRTQRLLGHLKAMPGEGVRVDGLLFVADAPGRLPRPLNDFTNILAGAAAHTWHVPWVEAWRYSTTPDDVPRALARVLEDLQHLTADAAPRR